MFSSHPKKEEVENIVGKGENAGTNIFSFFLQYVQKTPFPESLKSNIVL